MKHIQTEKILLYAILGLLLFHLNRQCNSNTNTTPISPKVSLVRDTVWQTKTDTFKLQTTRYKTVYVHKNDVNTIIDSVPNNLIASEFKAAKVYRDTLSNDDISIYSYGLIEGTLLNNKLTYELKVPREITVTKTIEHPKEFRSALFAFGEVGGNQQQFSNLSLGLQYNRKGNWFASYRINLNEFNNPTHHIGVGVRLFK